MKDLLHDLTSWIKKLEPLAERDRELKQNLSEFTHHIKTLIRGNIDIEGDDNRISIRPQTNIYLNLRGDEQGDRLIEAYQQALAQQVKQLPWGLSIRVSCAR